MLFLPHVRQIRVLLLRVFRISERVFSLSPRSGFPKSAYVRIESIFFYFPLLSTPVAGEVLLQVCQRVERDSRRPPRRREIRQLSTETVRDPEDQGESTLFMHCAVQK